MEVFNDGEMDRIVALPRRPHTWSLEDTERARDLLTNWLKTPNGTRRLKADQARALVEAADTGRLVGAICPGGGKSLITFLLGTVLEAQRVLILLPAKVRKQTWDVHAEWSQHFRIPQMLGIDDAKPAAPGPVIRIQSYETLSRIQYAAFIEEYEPDLVICDEAHMLARLSAGRSKRVFRYVKRARDRGARVVFVPLSGSFWRKKLREGAFLMELALENGSPLPMDYDTLEQWGYALDEGVKPELRLKPGALLRLCPQIEHPTLDQIRTAVHDRMVDTAGVVASTEAAVDIPLIIQVRPIEVPDTVRQAMYRLRSLWELPNGDDAGEALQFWAHAREILCGFAYEYKVMPPDEWKNAKRDWNAFVRAKMEHPGSFMYKVAPGDTCWGLGNRFGCGEVRLRELNENYSDPLPVGRPLKVPGVYDTPLMVWNATLDGRFGVVPEFERWQELRHTFEPETVPRWLDPFLLNDAQDWAIKNNGIVWVSHAAAYLDDPQGAEDALGKSFTRIPYFGAGNDKIRKYKGPCAASIRAHGTGLNLTQWSQALMLMPPSSGATMQQLLCRLWRTGQQADDVTFHVYQHGKEAVAAMITAMKDARFMESITGNIQGILGATMLAPDGSRYDPEAFLEAQTEKANPDPMFALEALDETPGPQ